MKKTFLQFLFVAMITLTLPLQAHLKDSRFDKWINTTNEKLTRNSRAIEVSTGLIEYVIKGEGPLVICLHGSFGGWDQGALIGSYLADHGFSVLSVSRPGYLGTPLSVGATNQAQADAISEMMTALDITKASVLGFSAGAPVAFQLAARHPQKVNALVLESIGQVLGDPMQYLLLTRFLNGIPANNSQQIAALDFQFYMLYLTTRFDYYSTMKEFLKADTTLTGAALNYRIHYIKRHVEQISFFKKFIFATMPVSLKAAGIANDSANALTGNWPVDPLYYLGMNTPTMIIQSVNDACGNFATAQYVNAQLSNSEFVSVEGSGHLIWLGSKTKDWQHKLKAFLKAHK